MSVVIRCRNEEHWVGHSIQSVLDFIDSPEIIIVDDHSKDESMDVVKMFETFSDVQSIQVDNYSPGKALNLGVSKATHKHVLILSAHCVITHFNEQKVKDILDDYVCVFGDHPLL